MPETQTPADMTADELRVEIAKAKGWAQLFMVADGQPIEHWKLCGCLGDRCDLVPDYPRDPAAALGLRCGCAGAALGLRAEMLDAGLYVDIHANKGDELITVGKSGSVHKTNPLAFEVRGCELLPLICRAYLEAHRRGWLPAAKDSPPSQS